MLTIEKTQPPRNLTILKGALLVLLKRDFAQFAATDKFAIDLYNWMQDMSVPDESFFSTLSSVRIGPENTVTQEIPKPTGVMEGKEVRHKSVLKPKIKRNDLVLYKSVIYFVISKLFFSFQCVRATFWYDNNCRGKLIRAVCNFGVKDIDRFERIVIC